MMSDEVTTISSIQYVIGGDLESVRSALIKSMLMNFIPYSQGENSASSSHRDSAELFQLYSPRWLLVGRLELDRVDHSQILLRFCLPAFPTETEIEFHERAIRDALPPPAAVIRIMDAEGDRVRALAYLGRYLHQFRIQCLQEIQSVLQSSLGLIPVYGLTIERQQVYAPATSSPNTEDQPSEELDRDIPRDNLVLRDDQQELVRLWQSGQTAKEIALRTSRTEKTVLNQLTLLRKSLGEELVPRRR
jgi:DNA-binding NarL/FixJ family response regulator